MPVDLDTADLAELQSIPGIGETSAQRIVTEREANGPIKSWHQLKVLAPKVNFIELCNLHKDGKMKSSIQVLATSLDIYDDTVVETLLSFDKTAASLPDCMIKLISLSVDSSMKSSFASMGCVTQTELATAKNDIKAELDKSLTEGKKQADASLEVRLEGFWGKMHHALSTAMNATIGVTLKELMKERPVSLEKTWLQSFSEPLDEDRVEGLVDRVEDRVEGLVDRKDGVLGSGKIGKPGSNDLKEREHKEKPVSNDLKEGEHKEKPISNEFNERLFNNPSFMRGRLEGNQYVSHNIRLAGVGRGMAKDGFSSQPHGARGMAKEEFLPQPHGARDRSKSHNKDRNRSPPLGSHPSSGRATLPAKQSMGKPKSDRVSQQATPLPKIFDEDSYSDSFSDYSADEEPDNRTPQGYSMDAKNIRLDWFEGKLGEWDDWFHKFKYMARACGWSNREKIFRLTTSLKYAALTAHRNLPAHVRNNFEQLCKAFKKRYGKSRWSTKAGLRAQLSSVQQNEGEDLEAFADRVQSLVIDSHPSGTPRESIDMYSVDHFLAGCRDKRAALLTYSTHVPESLFDAVEHMRLIQASSQRLGFKNDVRQVNFDPALIVGGESRVRSLSTSDPDACHVCGGQGHYARECPNRRRRSPSPLQCHKCNGRGHLARECTSTGYVNSNQSRGSSPRGSDSPNWRSRQQGSGSPRGRSSESSKPNTNQREGSADSQKSKHLN